MNTKEIDILNIILIILSLVLAFNLPFQLFVFSYAFLGPLHYLTEINWLKEKNYFVKQTKWIWFFIALVFVISIPIFLQLDILSGVKTIPWIKNTAHLINSSINEVITFALLLAAGLVYFKSTKSLIIFLVVSCAAAMTMLHYFSDYAMLITIFVPTLIHVYLFTFLFMIYGTIQSKSTPGIIAIILVFLVPLIIAFSKINPTEYYNLSKYTQESFDSSNFGFLIVHIAKPFLSSHEPFGFFSVLGIKIQIFIAFAYTYHYLNWFSKTSIIKWNKGLSRSKINTIIGIWIASVALYLYNFKIGFIVLSFLSVSHVFLEFPLNITSIKGIVAALKSKIMA